MEPTSIPLRAGLVQAHYVDETVLFTPQQMQYRLPNRHQVVQQNTRSCQIEPWYEDSSLPFDVISTWVSETFRGLPNTVVQEQPERADLVGTHVSMTEFALDFYSADSYTIMSSDEEPNAEEAQHWASVYDEVHNPICVE